MLRVFAVIPAFNEEGSIADVVTGVRPFVQSVIVGDNNSRDATAEHARNAGATVVAAPIQGYGSACLAAIAEIRSTLRPNPDDVLIFIDADGCEDRTKIPELIEPIIEGRADLVIGSRRRLAAPGSMTPQQIFGNRLATILIHLIWRHRYTDLGPLRAIRWQSYESLDMSDPNYGWTVEMQIKAIRRNLRVMEIDVPYRSRASGESKIAGTLTGSIRAGYKILYLIAKHGLRRR